MPAIRLTITSWLISGVSGGAKMCQIGRFESARQKWESKQSLEAVIRFQRLLDQGRYIFR